MVLNDLGLEVEKYVSSEVDMDAVNVCRIHYPQAINVGDVCCITEKEVWFVCELEYYMWDTIYCILGIATFATIIKNEA